MILYIIRHAWAEDADESRWPDDFDRPLTPEGEKRFAKVVRVLAERGFAPEVVAASPAVRCRQTAEIVARGLGDRKPSPRLAELDALAPGSDLAGAIAWAEKEAADCDQVAWVGHAPDVGHLTAALIGGPQAWIHFAKGAVAAVEFDDVLEPHGGELRWLTTAKLLGC